MIRVVIADDHVIFRQGLLKLLQSARDISVIGEAGNGNEILNLIIRERPDLAILDISMTGISGLEIAEEIRNKKVDTKVIFLTMHNDPLTAKKAILSGASGYIIKDNAFEDLLYAIRAVASGGKFISPSISEKVLNSCMAKEVGNHILTVRESEILRLIASGLSNKQIADKLFISVKTVETHRTKIIQKLDLHTTADLVRYAIRTGLLKE
ncbi:MAG: DNA-binding response regulator [Nitrospirae bacterium RBG_13_41_22]|nr:MAG: DNA-binding response regulator [Nitrospirae bacterium RBG_13_41_22]